MCGNERDGPGWNCRAGDLFPALRTLTGRAARNRSRLKQSLETATRIGRTMTCQMIATRRPCGAGSGQREHQHTQRQNAASELRGSQFFPRHGLWESSGPGKKCNEIHWEFRIGSLTLSSHSE